MGSEGRPKATWVGKGKGKGAGLRQGRFAGKKKTARGMPCNGQPSLSSPEINNQRKNAGHREKSHDTMPAVIRQIPWKKEREGHAVRQTLGIFYMAPGHHRLPGGSGSHQWESFGWGAGEQVVKAMG